LLGKRQNGNNAQVNQKFPISQADYVRAICLRQTGKNWPEDDQLAILYFDAFGDILYAAAPSGTPKPIADAELVLPEGPKKRRFSPCCGDDLADIGPAAAGPAPVKASPPPARPKSTKQFPPAVKKGMWFDVPDGIVAHLTRECGANVHDRHVVDVTCGSFEPETMGPIQTRGYMIMIHVGLQRTRLIRNTFTFRFSFSQEGR
jgi:hypothetical protein